MLTKIIGCALTTAALAATLAATSADAVAGCRNTLANGKVITVCTDGGGGGASSGSLPEQRTSREQRSGGHPRLGNKYHHGPIRGIDECTDPRSPDVLRPMCHSVPYADPPPDGPEAPQGQPGPRISPEQAAREAVATLELPTPTIRYGPRPEDTYYKMHFIGVPYWYWTTNTGGQRTHTVTHQGITITYTTGAPAIWWDFGDGTVLACGPGTPYHKPVFEAEESPTCGHRYQQPGHYTVTVTATWQVHWAAMGTGGTIPVTTTASDGPNQYHEIHSLLVEPN